MKKNSTDFAKAISNFLTNYLPYQRNYSRNTIVSYRDTIKLFLKFCSEQKGISPNSFRLADFTKPLVIEFLENYRKSGASNASANQRLAALKTFAEYAQIESLDYMGPLQQVGGIKGSRQTTKEIGYWSVEQISKLINKPDLHTLGGLRHRVILTTMYDSACRVQELCDLTIGSVKQGNLPTLQLVGKGNKTRIVPVSKETGNLLAQYIRRVRPSAINSDPLFVNRYGAKLNRAGVNYIVDKYASEIQKEDPTFPKKACCHMLRHSKAMHMLAAGINIVYIRDFLGHASISTTMIYAKADNCLKEKAINALAPKIVEQSTSLPDWRDDRELMDFLNSL